MPQRLEDAHEVAVEVVAAHDGLIRRQQVRGPEDETAVLPATQPTVAADQRLEGGHVQGAIGIDDAVHVELRRPVQHRRRPHHRGGVVTEREQRVVALDRAGAEVASAGPADHDGTVSGQRTDETYAVLGDETGNQGRPARLDLLEQQPLRPGT